MLEDRPTSSTEINLTGKVIVVTGARGLLGSGLCRALLAQGAKVAAIDVAPSPSAIELCKQNALQIVADVTSREALDCALVQITSEFGLPDGLVNMAAIDAPPSADSTINGPFETNIVDDSIATMRVNFFGAMCASQVFGGSMAAARGGSIVNISSMYGLVSPDQRIYEYRRSAGEQFYKPAAYGASKAALDNLSRYLATYWGQHNVRVNSVNFGGIQTAQEVAFIKAYSKKSPMGRLGRPEETIGPILFLLSDLSSYMTGAQLIVDGGWTAW